MLETINLENANGIIANFTGGDDLSFAEVTDALVYLQQKTNSQIEIVPGVISDKRMQGRAQVTLVITGIGGTAVNSQKFEGVRQPFEKKATSVADPAQSFVLPTVTKEAVPQFEMAGTPSDLDIPAFMRRRVY